MIQIIPTAKEPTYEELKETCAWLKRRFKEARSKGREEDEGSIRRRRIKLGFQSILTG